MKITRKVLENLIREEVESVIKEQYDYNAAYNVLVNMLTEYKKASVSFPGIDAEVDAERKAEQEKRKEELRPLIGHLIDGLVPPVDLTHKKILAMSLKKKRKNLKLLFEIAESYRKVLEELQIRTSEYDDIKPPRPEFRFDDPETNKRYI